ncbi:hypothetical protein [Zobellia nedashkovskayae]|uniref:hypothetical protein n=1 Tax=Zobellia nedashkovskayae TaxID=2779510 RepID=UPI00188B04D5|nr:hypothetical protein [Zobellia nedashkovskayae]
MGKIKGSVPQRSLSELYNNYLYVEIDIQPTYELQISESLTTGFDSKGIKIDSIGSN